MPKVEQATPSAIAAPPQAPAAALKAAAAEIRSRAADLAAINEKDIAFGADKGLSKAMIDRLARRQ